MVRFPFIKINLGLQVLRKRPDGYHDINTAFYPVRHCFDALEIVPAEGKTALHQSGIVVPGNPEENLVLKAYRLMAANQSVQGLDPLPELDIHLLKRIPTGAGVGGGSSDASHMLLMLNEFAQLNLSKETLAQLAGQLGSDCPFFIQGVPMLGAGRGGALTPLPGLDLSAYYIRIIFPGIHVPTAEAYAGVVPDEKGESLEDILTRPVTEWKGRLENAFEPSVFARHPQLADIKQILYEEGALYAAMSGSGSSVFGIYDHLPAAEEGWGKHLGHECFNGQLSVQ
jgi:4-diphosphocytidyl-2-C-methyl-D-erythritol kinase